MSRHNRRRSPLQVKPTVVGAGMLAARDGGLSSAGSYATGGKSKVSGSRPGAWNRCATLTVPSGWTTRRCRCSAVHPGRSLSLPAVVNWS